MNKIEIEKEILFQIAERKNEAKIKAIKYLDYAYSNQEFKELDKEYRGLVVDLAKAEFENKNIEKIKENLENIAKNREKYAKNLKIDLNAFTEDYHYTCKLCGDTGFVNGQKCVCYKKIFNEIMLNQSHFTSTLPRLSDFNKLLLDNENVAKSLMNMLNKYINDFPKVPSVFVFQGTVGVGKSFMAQIIMRELIEKNYIVNYFSAFDFSKTLKDWHFSDMREKTEYESLFMDCDLLIIDDLGTEPIYNNINYEYMQNIFDQRLYKGLPTIVITNVDTDKFIELYGERLYSRIFYGRNTKCYKIENSDIRKKLQEQNKKI